jgi:hypothetical protein
VKRFLVKCVNVVLLVLVVIGIPSITRVEFHGWQLGSGSKLQLLLFWTLALALGFNILAALFFMKVRKDRLLCWEWAAVFGVLLFTYCAFLFGYLDFTWLKNFLQRAQSHL